MVRTLAIEASRELVHGYVARTSSVLLKSSSLNYEIMQCVRHFPFTKGLKRSGDHIVGKE